jgi:hypothetical protein
LHKTNGYLDCISCIKARNGDSDDYWSIDEDLTPLLNSMDSYYSANNINAVKLTALVDQYASKVKVAIIAELDRIIQQVIRDEYKIKIQKMLPSFSLG